MRFLATEGGNHCKLFTPQQRRSKGKTTHKQLQILIRQIKSNQYIIMCESKHVISTYINFCYFCCSTHQIRVSQVSVALYRLYFHGSKGCLKHPGPVGPVTGNPVDHPALSRPLPRWKVIGPQPWGNEKYKTTLGQTTFGFLFCVVLKNTSMFQQNSSTNQFCDPTDLCNCAETK